MTIALAFLGYAIAVLFGATIIRLELQLDRIERKVTNWRLDEPDEDFVRFVQRDPSTAFQPKGRTH